jgi:hypothetical protein
MLRPAAFLNAAGKLLSKSLPSDYSLKLTPPAIGRLESGRFGMSAEPSIVRILSYERLTSFAGIRRNPVLSDPR